MRVRSLQALGAALVLGAFVAGCAGSRGAAPSVPSFGQAVRVGGTRVHTAAVAPGADVVAVDAGGGASGTFAADADYAAGSFTYTTSSAIATSAIASPAPQAVYQSEREGSGITYTIPGLTAGASYTVRLSFAEIWWTAAGKRVFNVAVNGTSVLSNFDIFATAGGANKAISESFPATASSTGSIVIALTTVTDHAAIDAIEILAPSGTSTPSPTASTTAAPAPSASPTKTPTPAPTTSAPQPSASGLYIDAGGTATGSFVADEDFSAGGWTYSTTKAIDLSGVTNPAPQAVYQTQHTGSSLSYTIPGLVAGKSYGVRLDFSELYWTAAGKREFDVSINGASVLTNFDIFATAGAEYRAVTKSFSATANTGGAIAIALSHVVDNPTVDGIEITSTGTATAAPTSNPTTAPTTAPTAAPTGKIAFNDYATFGYDNQRDAFNPNSTAITPASLSAVHLAWQSTLGGGDYNTQTQPILATEIPNHAGVIFVGGGSGNVYGYDALTGALMWTRNTGQEQYSCENGYNAYFGVGGTAAYDPSSKSIYIVGNQNASQDAIATNSLYHLDGATGAILGQVNFAPPVNGWKSLDFSHTAVTLGNNGLAYVGTGATCDISSWRGRLAAVSVPAMTLANTYYPAWNGTTQPWGGAGVWGWGGASLDFSGNVMFGTGNTDNGSTSNGAIVAPYAASPEEYSGNGEALVQMSGDLSTVNAANHPIPTSIYSGASLDLDLNGTPTVFRPNGSVCDPMAAIQGKSGSLYLYDTTRIGNGPVAQYQLAPSTYADGFLGAPGYSPVTGLLYVGVPSSNESLFAPGMIAINPGCGNPSVAWNAGFGPDSYAAGSLTSPGEPRSVPAASAGGVVFIGTICTSSGSGCSATASNARRIGARAQAVRRPLICCAPPGTSGGALWALDASTGTVLNGGNPVIVTSGQIRMPPTIDGNWIFVLDDNGDLYGLTIDPSYPAIASKYRAPSSRQRSKWSFVGPK